MSARLSVVLARQRLDEHVLSNLEWFDASAIERSEGGFTTDTWSEARLSIRPQ